MSASYRFSLKLLLSSLAIALVLVTPHTFAKKDLFATDPADKSVRPAEQLVPNSASSRELVEEASEIVSSQEQANSSSSSSKAAELPHKKPSYLATQYLRFKDQLAETTEDLFGKKKSAKEAPALHDNTEPTTGNVANSSEETPPEVVTISATDAAQRAQSFAEGQVINVRKYQEDHQPRYAVKLLQKNGRMKTINLDAVSGALIEDTPQ